MLSSQLNNITTHYSFPRTSLIEIGGRHGSLGSKREKRVAKRLKELFIQQGPGRIHLESTAPIAELNHAGMLLPRVTIGSLPDEVLLEIFYAYKESLSMYSMRVWHECWLRLVHVCRRWRSVIFASPHYLNLQLHCTPTRPVRKMLDIWPAFPLVIDFQYCPAEPSEDYFDNFFAALERRDRVHEISVSDLPGFVWEQITTVAQEPFPALTLLDLEHYDGLASGDIFLNGSAPNLQHLSLFGISIPRRLGSATHLRSLELCDIPNSGYIPPETMAISLSALLQLEELHLEFRSPTPQPKRRNRPVPPQTRFTLPTLTELEFRGVSEYLEVLTARIDTPPLEHVSITFFHQPVFDIPQIIRFFSHQDFGLFKPSDVTLCFGPYLEESIKFHDPIHCVWDIRCERLDWQVFSIAQICSQILSFRSSVESLNIMYYGDSHSEDEIDPRVWLQLFHSFTSVQSLEIPAMLEPFIAPTLQGLTEESAAEVFPSLRNLSIMRDPDMSLEGETTQQGIQSFVAARQRSGLPVAVTRREYS
jgi:F-box-like